MDKMAGRPGQWGAQKPPAARSHGPRVTQSSSLVDKQATAQPVQTSCTRLARPTPLETLPALDQPHPCAHTHSRPWLGEIPFQQVWSGLGICIYYSCLMGF